MITINKSNEPIEWTKFCATPGVSYSPIPELRESLLKEQGNICAYCMRRIPTKDINIEATSKIEHVISQHEKPDLQLKYSNMVLCCPGNLNNEPHCDNLKKGKSVSFNLINSDLEKSIKYSSKDGNIESSNIQWNNEMNSFLNLNHKLLKQNRKETISGIIETIKSKGWNTASLKTNLKKWKSTEDKDKLKPFCGIVIWYLERKLKK